MWGSDYPHDEGTYPFSREHLRLLFHDTPEPELRKLLGTNVAALTSSTWPRGAGRRRIRPTVEEIATPLSEMPADANTALLAGVSGWSAPPDQGGGQAGTATGSPISSAARCCKC